MELTPSQLEQLKKEELELLKAFLKVCEQLQLKYFLLCGTLLGAVRHEGFIPWDDDIDVGMPRADYESFLQAAQALLPRHIFLQTHNTDPEYPLNFAKLRNCNTTFVERSMAHRKINHGIYIDIFPIDYYPDSGRLVFQFRSFLSKLRVTYAFSTPNMKKRTRFVRFFTRFIYPSLPGTVKRREKMFQSVAACKHMIVHAGIYGKREIVPAFWYDNHEILTFEELPVRVSSHYRDYLTQIYGDYMQLPPPEKRIPHHYVSAFDLEKPYTHYCK